MDTSIGIHSSLLLQSTFLYPNLTMDTYFVQKKSLPVIVLHTLELAILLALQHFIEMVLWVVLTGCGYGLWVMQQWRTSW